VFFFYFISYIYSFKGIWHSKMGRSMSRPGNCNFNGFFYLFTTGVSNLSKLPLFFSMFPYSMLPSFPSNLNTQVANSRRKADFLRLNRECIKNCFEQSFAWLVFFIASLHNCFVLIWKKPSNQPLNYITLNSSLIFISSFPSL
jgi:hypothetical protein